jgi:hypothetical protein
MASYNKFNQFVEDLVNGVHDFDAHTFKIYLSNTTPSASLDLVKTDLAEIAAGNGYTAGGATTTITTSEASGTAKVVGTDVSWTASGGAIAQFRYAVFYNDTPTSPTDPLISWWDYGSAVDLADTESFTVDLDATNGIFQLA